MKATGVVRRIDDLGRVVIPKEIRKVHRIKEGDPLEIFTDKEGEIILKKYSPIGELTEFASTYADTISKTTGHITCITDKDTVIAVAGGSKKDFLEKGLSKDVKFYLEFFKYGCPPHGGFAIGVDRITMLLLETGSLKETMFIFRGPNRIEP